MVKKRVIKIALIILGVLLLLLVGLIFFSPYKYYDNDNYRSIQVSVVIDAPVDEVFSYLGNSNNAQYWSTFVDHITTLNHKEVKDGMVGSKRRCFQEANEEGIFWDEEIIDVVKNKKRKLTIYNLHGFNLQADGLVTEQQYETLENNKCKLTFSLFFEEAPGMVDLLKMYISSYKVKSIFVGNLNNVKELIEKKHKEI